MSMDYTDYYLHHPNYTEEPGYVYDELEAMIDGPHRESPFWYNPRFLIRHSLEVQRAEKERLAAEQLAATRVPYDGVNTHIWDNIGILPPGIYTERFFGDSVSITNDLNRFHQTLHRVYNDQAKVLSSNAVQMNNGTCMFTTYQIF